ncbi:MAG: GlsB/YeaQ/YmgE family stress response membrane protein [Solirubrobacterales bacterium]
MIGAIILGIIAGYLGRLIMPGKRDIGFIMTTILGVIGALVGFFIFTELLGIGDSEAFDLGGLPGAVIGVILVLFIYDRVAGRGRPATT